jgi:putative ABC transport system substrate-binding protein
MKIKTFLLILITAVITIIVWKKYTSPLTKSALDDGVYTVGIIQVVEHPALDQTRAGIMDVLKEHGYVDSNNSRIYYESAQGNPALATQIVQKFIGLKADVIVAIGTTVAQTAKQATQENKTPVIFASVSDPLQAKLVDSLESPTGNVTGVSNFVSISKQFAFFKRILPHLKQLGSVYNPGEANSVSIISKMNEVSDVFDITIHTTAATKTVEVMAATQNLLQKAEAIFVNNDNTALSAIDVIIKVATERGIPVFTSDIDCLDKGALAALGPDQYELGKQAGRMAHRILQDESPSSIPVEMPKIVHTKVNTVVAEKLGITYKKDKVETFGG